MIKLMKEVGELIKREPEEFFGSIFLLGTMFGMFYVSMWIFY